MSEEATVFEEAGITSEEPEAPTPENEVETPDYEVNPNEPVQNTERPEWLPEKFSSPEELAEAYNQMGKKIREVQQGHAPEKYELKDAEGNDIALSTEDEERYKQMGLTNDQAQALEEYFEKEVLPQLTQIRTDYELEKLADSWGTGKDSPVFKERMQSLYRWAEKNLPPEIMQEMGRSASGIQTLQKMMDKGYSTMNTDTSTPKRSKAELESMVQDERYWKDPAFREKVDQAYRQAYGS